MSGRLKKGGVIAVIVIAAAQLVRPAYTNPPTDTSQTLRAFLDGASQLPAIIDRACGDCHSNESRWPWYTQIAPLSWVMVRAVDEGRDVVNFSTWGAYSPQQRQSLLAASCSDAKQGRMPVGAYTWFHPEAKLTPGDVESICAASR